MHRTTLLLFIEVKVCNIWISEFRQRCEIHTEMRIRIIIMCIYFTHQTIDSRIYCHF